MEFNEYWDQIYEKSHEMDMLITSYWQEYSHMGTWQFWVVTLLLVGPLILLCFTVDRKRIFELFFFGYTVHILWSYMVIFLQNHSFLIHKYFFNPYLPFALNMTASALPVAFLLLYQYCTNHKKNFYLYTIILSAVFAFGFATIEEMLGLLEFNKGMNKFYLFLIDLVIVFITYWFTKWVLKIRRRAS
ncbi:hypothetical protein [Halalkalibacter okhensis]|uniref:Uncharacterized protein n=1 Tax=Halalkalibacter okhensis TaxID=333138 RepID=A0A0B0IA67_9BACI|nr:hypothetical protein [Halalkalibacter okhensis]KHF39418.1 hypothetical protein LQ50_15265 [Halalkalibacter okhensis]